MIDSSGIDISQVLGFLIVNDPNSLAAGKRLSAILLPALNGESAVSVHRNVFA
jgi:hypothetical protein